ncbi:I78 family peptidase inhibitor [Tropicimonas aquimaris]|uniref:I78 family peptidase inhibitor n=1 Tax=Tropicimonas aquimaris TaxID=914152 RepID=A0ABW3IYB8_9RHOB
MRLKFAALPACLLGLAACDPVVTDPITESTFVANPAPPPVVDPIPPADPVAVSPIDGGGNAQPGVDPALELVEVNPYGEVREGAGGLTERLPDTCKLGEVQQYMGQSGASVEAGGLTMPYRVVGPTDIVTQEYNPTRINFFVDSAGQVTRISCG